MSNLKKKCNELEKKLTLLQSNFIPGSCVKTPLNAFQTPEFKKVMTADPLLVAEIALPCARGKEKQFDLIVNKEEIREIFKSVSIA
jgi:hypothetical protein